MANRFNAGKVKWSLLPWDALQEACKVFMMGALKYGAFNWCTPPYLSFDDITDSLHRHMYERQNNRLKDKESGLLHSAHMVCNALFLLTYDLRGYFKNGKEKDV